MQIIKKALGWVKWHRQIQDWEWYQDGNTFRVFFHLVTFANSKDRVWKGIEIKRGQKLTSRAILASELGLSVQNIRTALAHLESTGEITIQSTKKYTLITVENYEEFQAKEDEPNQESNQVNNQEVTNSQPSGNQVVTINKNNKNYKTDKNTTITDKNNNKYNARAREEMPEGEDLPEELSKDMEKYIIMCGETHGIEITPKHYRRSVDTLQALGHGNVGEMKKILQNAVRDHDKYLRPL